MKRVVIIIQSWNNDWEEWCGKNAIYTMIDEEIIYELYYFKTLKTI